MKKIFSLLVMVFLFGVINAQKTWVGTTGGTWNTPANWSPSGVPTNTDDVVFNNSTNMVVVLDFVTSTTINSLSISGTANVTFNNSANVTINLGGGGTSGTALSIVAGRNLILNSTTTASIGIILSIPTNYTASINGTLSLTQFSTTPHTGVAATQANQLIAADANSVQVNSGGTITVNVRQSSSVYPFGTTGTNNAVVFNSGSTFTHYGGSGPWGNTTAPNGIADFKSGSTFNVFSATSAFSPSLGGRTLGILNVSCGCSPANISNATAVTTTIEDLTFNAASSNVSMPFFAASGSTASPTYALGNIKINQNGSGTNTATISLRNDGASGTNASYTISGDIVLGTSAGTQVSTLNLGAVSLTTGTGTTTITFTGANKSITPGSVGTQNIGIGGNNGTANYTTNLVVQAGASLTLNRNLSLLGATSTTATNLTIQPTGVLNVAAGSVLVVGNTTTLTNNGSLKLLSNSTSTGSIGNSLGTINGTGSVTVQRYIPSGRRTSRFLGHPFGSALDMSSLIDNIYITGDGTTSGTGGVSPGSGFDATGTNAASAFWFDNGGAQAWKAFTNTTDASWLQYRGIRVLIRGDRTQPTSLTGGNPTPNAVTLDMSGTVNTGAQNIIVPTGYSVVSNPYPSPVDLGTRLNATTNIGTQYWVWDANAGPTAGAYVTKTVSATPYNLAMNAAFVVSPAASTTIAFVESDKQATATTNLFRTNTLSGFLELQVLYNNYPADNMFVRFNTSSSDNKDALDGEKLNNPEVNFYALSGDSKKLSLDTRPFTENKIIPLGFTATASNSFKIKVVDYGINEDVYLKDKFLNTLTKLDVTTEYSFSVDLANAASLGENRFELIMKTNSALSTTFLNVSAAQKNAGIEVTWNTANETNMSSYEVEESSNGTSFTKATIVAAKNATSNAYSWLDATVTIGDNFYRIKSVEKNGATKYSNVVKVKIGTKGTEFTVYPNSVKGGVVSLQMSNVEKGIYTVKIYNNIGQEVANQNINHNGGSATQTIDLGKGIATGNYSMQITNRTTTVTKTIIVE